MKLISLFITVLLSMPASAIVSAILGGQGLRAVELSSDEFVSELANGVCAVKDFDGRNCCTGFFVADDMVMTNYHCLNCLSPMANFEPSAPGISFGYGGTNDFKVLNSRPEFFGEIELDLKESMDSPDRLQPTPLRIKEILAGEKSLDFLILKVEQSKSDLHRINTLSDREPEIDQGLITIGYPNQSPYPGEKVYDSTEECRVTTPQVPYHQDRINSFGHHCDTNPGSSGSPVFDKITGRVLGIHWGGGEGIPGLVEDVWRNDNHAIGMGAITDFLRDHHPLIYEDLNIQ